MATPKPMKARRVTKKDKAELAARRLVEAKARRDAALEDIAEAEKELMAYLESIGQKSTKLDLGTFTRVQKESVRTDYDRLKTAVGSQMWNKITSRVIDKTKLEAQVAAGEIPTSTLAECSEIVPNKPYILATIKKGT